jgi:hypothetical protein
MQIVVKMKVIMSPPGRILKEQPPTVRAARPAPLKANPAPLKNPELRGGMMREEARRASQAVDSSE